MPRLLLLKNLEIILKISLAYIVLETAIESPIINIAILFNKLYLFLWVENAFSIAF